MNTEFNPQEILKIAVKVEENGKSLYETLQAKAKDEKLKDMWKYLKEQEENHIKIFKEVLSNIGDYIVYDFSLGDYDAYLRAIASEYIFTQELIEKKTKEVFTLDVEAIDFVIAIEKESILVYSALKEYIVTGKQSVLGKIIEEERKHLVQLTSMKKQIRV